eukprot:gnl/Spiro4/11308_TR5967_c0_g1_i1.p1 gnl/Spiro4/11308_TR5967_c0_g1~~gnl/Spiro4/11308_TR5967_c0_g1_i1.p1  ORF type:complete len:368 (+),score=92.19 gnl/Spiro4/11308_TR5967_c0_g1_i1:43-1104(+)
MSNECGCSSSLCASDVHEMVSAYYTELRGTSDLKTQACCSLEAPSAAVQDALSFVPRSVTDSFYGCGNPLPSGMRGLRCVVDLGCGTGRDVFSAAVMVGAGGRVVGVDMTDKQLNIARAAVGEFESIAAQRSRGVARVEFVKADIERISDEVPPEVLSPGCADVVISNCVVNLSSDKLAVLRQVHRLLRNGGEFHFSDVYSDRRLSAAAREHPVLLGECLGGALYENDFLRLAAAAGFVDARVLSRRPVPVAAAELPDLKHLLADAKFESVTYRLFKVANLEVGAAEDYGEHALYNGTVEGSLDAYQLDRSTVLPAHQRVRVCGNVALILRESWLAPHFRVDGDRAVHYGEFR